MDFRQWPETPKERSHIILTLFNEALDRAGRGLLIQTWEVGKEPEWPSVPETTRELRTACACMLWWEHKYAHHWYDDEEKRDVTLRAYDAFDALDVGKKGDAVGIETWLGFEFPVSAHTNRAVYEYLNDIRTELLIHSWDHSPWRNAVTSSA